MQMFCERLFGSVVVLLLTKVFQTGRVMASNCQCILFVSQLIRANTNTDEKCLQVVVCCRCIFIFVGRQCFLLFFFLVFSSICIDFLFFLFLFWFGFLGYFGGVFFPSNHCLNPETLLVFCFLEEKQGQCPVTHPHICEDAALQCQSFFQEEFSRDSGQPQPR